MIVRLFDFHRRSLLFWGEAWRCVCSFIADTNLSRGKGSRWPIEGYHDELLPILEQGFLFPSLGDWVTWNCGQIIRSVFLFVFWHGSMFLYCFHWPPGSENTKTLIPIRNAGFHKSGGDLFSTFTVAHPTLWSVEGTLALLARLPGSAACRTVPDDI